VAVPVQLGPAKYSYVTVPVGVKVSAPCRIAESVTESPAVMVEAESDVEMDRVALITLTVYVTRWNTAGLTLVPFTTVEKVPSVEELKSQTDVPDVMVDVKVTLEQKTLTPPNTDTGPEKVTVAVNPFSESTLRFSLTMEFAGIVIVVEAGVRLKSGARLTE
jgi:hypothetical protein